MSVSQLICKKTILIAEFGVKWLVAKIFIRWRNLKRVHRKQGDVCDLRNSQLLVDFRLILREISDNVIEHNLSVLNQHYFVYETVGFCGDNCNTNFGEAVRRGGNNVFVQTKTANRKKPGRNRMCSTHSTQLPSNATYLLASGN